MYSELNDRYRIIFERLQAGRRVLIIWLGAKWTADDRVD